MSIKNLRLGNANPFDSRTVVGKKEPKKTYIIYTEGIKTEYIYFSELIKSKVVSDNIKVMPIKRNNSGSSNPYTIVQDIVSSLEDLNGMSDKEKNKLKKFAENYSGFNITEFLKCVDYVKKLCQKYRQHVSNESEVTNFLQFLSKMSTFDKEYDNICIIIDRDQHSFTEYQYEQTLKLCEENNFKLGITNPCFEFYLLLHFDNIDNLKIKDIKENKKKGKKTFVERELNEKIKELPTSNGTGFKKNNYNAIHFINNFDVGLENVKKYSLKNTELKDNVGSSVFEIVKELIE